MKYLIDPMDLSVEEINELIDIANDIIKDRTRYQDVCRHKILATLFLNQVHVQDFLLNQLCYHLVEVF